MTDDEREAIAAAKQIEHAVPGLGPFTVPATVFDLVESAFERMEIAHPETGELVLINMCFCDLSQPMPNLRFRNRAMLRGE